MKKFIAFMLTFCLLFSSFSFGALAVDTTSEEYKEAVCLVANSHSAEITEAHINQIANDLELIQSTSFSIFNNYAVIGINENGNILYEMNITDNTTAVFFVEKNSAGNIIIDITEDSIHNVMTFDGNSIYIDGNKVSFSNTDTPSVQPYSSNPSARIATNQFSTTPLYGTSSIYTGYTGTTTKNSVGLGNTWNSISKTAATTALAAALVAAGLAGFAAYSSLIVDVAEWAINQGSSIPTSQAYMSFKYDTYVPATQPAFALHWKLNCKFYSATNCSGSYYSKTLYEAYYY